MRAFCVAVSSNSKIMRARLLGPAQDEECTRAARAAFRAGHLTAADALALLAQLDARWLVPYHWGTFNHVTSGAFDAVRELRALLPGHALAERVRVLEPGGSHTL